MESLVQIFLYQILSKKLDESNLASARIHDKYKHSHNYLQCIRNIQCNTGIEDMLHMI